MNQRQWTAVSVISLLALSGQLACKQRSAKSTAEQPPTPGWFSNLNTKQLDATTSDAVVRAIWDRLHDKTATLPQRPGHAAVFVSMSDGTSAARVVHGIGSSLQAAVQSAVTSAKAQRPPTIRWLRVDFVTEVFRRTSKQQRLSVRRGLDGVAMGAAKAVVPGVFNLADRQSRSAMRRDGAAAFRTSAHFYDGNHVEPLFRGHRRQRRATAQTVLNAATAGGQYLIRMRHDSGRFLYSYLPAVNRAASSYNLVRHAGTVYSMFQLYRVTNDAPLRKAAEQSLAYLLRYIKPYKGAAILRSKRRIKLGGVALAAVAIAEHIAATRDKRHLRTAQLLCAYIADSQRSNGSFVHSRVFSSGKERSFRSQYYPGEAMLALLRVHAIDGNPRWLGVAQRAAQYLITGRDKNIATADLTHDHWLLYALNELYRAHKKPLYLQHASRIVEAIVAKQTVKSDTQDYVGSYYTPPRSTPTATRTEGLLAAHALIAEFGDKQLAKRIRRAVKLGIEFQLQTQITRERAMYVSAPQRSLGGFTRSLTNFEVRIDYVQHNISALILFHQLLSSKD